MKRIKVINEPSDLVPMLLALDTPVKREVFSEISRDWFTAQQIEEKFGEDGKIALQFFEKMKLVETMWQTNDSNQQEKTYHTYYMSFHINTSCPVNEISDVLSVAVMPDKKYKELEDKLIKVVEEEGEYAGHILETMQISATMLKSIVKRSSKLEYRGHRIEQVKDLE